MNEFVALVLVLVLATSGYAAGRLHGQFSYRLGYRLGYRQGYFDGDRASWNRRRRDLQAAVASVLATPPQLRTDAFPPTTPHGTTYSSTVRAAAPDADDETAGDDAAAHDRGPLAEALVDMRPEG